MYAICSIGGVDVVEHICDDETNTKFDVDPPLPPVFLSCVAAVAEFVAVVAPATTPITSPLAVVVTIAAVVDDDELMMRIVDDEFELKPPPFVTNSASVLPTMSRVRFGTRPYRTAEKRRKKLPQ